MDNPFNNPSILSICPGLLGLDRGIERAVGKTRTVAYVEIEAVIVANLIAGMQAGILDAAPVWSDIKTFDAKPFRKKIHGILAGYPCQPFSLAGKRSGADHPGHIYPYISNAFRTIKPVWGFFENVGGHLSMGFDLVYKDLRSMGYAVEAGIYTAEQVGAPHERERLFILAIAGSFLQHARRKRMGWETWANISRSSTGSELANTHNRTFINASGKNDTNSEEQRLQKWNSLQESGITDQLEHTSSQPGWQETKGGLAMDGKLLSETGRNESTNGFGSSGELAHTDSTGQQEQWKNGKQNGTSDAGIGNTSTNVPNTNSTNGKRSLEGRKERGRPIITDVHCWPARPGQEQYEWEEKRTIESGMGCTAHGYNFREDLLRGLGNMVVEQQAELAFIDLLWTHFKNVNRNK